MGYSDNSPLQAALAAASDAEVVAAAASDAAAAAEADAIAVSVQRDSNGSDFANKPAVLVNIGAEAFINKGAVSGYAPLDVSQQVPAANAPAKAVYSTGGGQALAPGDIGADAAGTARPASGGDADTVDGQHAAAFEVAGAAATAEANANGYTDTQVAIVGGRVGAPVADVAALRAVASATLPDKQLRLSETTEAIYSWDAEGTGADDGDGTIVPTDITPPAPGRWFKTTVASQNHEALVGLLGGAVSDHQHLTTAQLALVNAAVQPGALGTAAAEDVAAGGTGDLLRADGDGSSLTGISTVIETTVPYADFYAGSEESGDFTMGGRFIPLQFIRVTGIRVQSAVAANPHTLKVSLWDSGGTLRASGTSACAGSGIYNISFSSEYAIVAADLGTYLTWGVYETSGTYYTKQAGSTDLTTMPVEIGPMRITEGPVYWSAGDARPATDGSAASRYTSGPIVEMDA